jgi:hypothetical protein
LPPLRAAAWYLIGIEKVSATCRGGTVGVFVERRFLQSRIFEIAVIRGRIGLTFDPRLAAPEVTGVPR